MGRRNLLHISSGDTFNIDKTMINQKYHEYPNLDVTTFSKNNSTQKPTVTKSLFILTPLISSPPKKNFHFLLQTPFGIWLFCAIVYFRTGTGCLVQIARFMMIPSWGIYPTCGALQTAKKEISQVEKNSSKQNQELFGY